MPTFAFIGHYLSTDHACQLLGRWGELLSRCPNGFIKEFIKRLPAHRYVDIEFQSSAGNRARGIGIMMPILPEHLVTWGEMAVVNKVISAGHLAQKMGAKIVGLAGFASVAGDEGRQVADHLQIAVTSGNTLTAALALEGMRKAAQMMGITWSDAVVAIIGATGDIGSICTKILSSEVRRINLAARNATRLQEFAGELRSRGRCEIRIEKYVRDAVKDANVILTATSAVTTIIEPSDLSPGAVLCDVAIPHNVGNEILKERNDVLVFEGGLAKLPETIVGSSQWKSISPDGQTVFGCFAETLVLALEQRWESYSLGRGRITPERVSEILALAQSHGLQLADFRYRGRVLDPVSIELIRQNAEKRRSITLGRKI